MKSTQYSEKTLEHFRNPRNVGTLEGPNVAVGRVGNPVCGDMMDIYIAVTPDDRIEDIKFQTFGCGSAVATSSMITELVKGMKLDDALKVSRGDVADALDGLPPIKMHCSNLAADALHEAIKNWRAGVKPEDATKTAVETACHPRPAAVVEVEIANLADYEGKGAYKELDDLAELADQRVVVLDTGDTRGAEGDRPDRPHRPRRPHDDRQGAVGEQRHALRPAPLGREDPRRGAAARVARRGRARAHPRPRPQRGRGVRAHGRRVRRTEVAPW